MSTSYLLLNFQILAVYDWLSEWMYSMIICWMSTEMNEHMVEWLLGSAHLQLYGPSWHPFRWPVRYDTYGMGVLLLSTPKWDSMTGGMRLLDIRRCRWKGEAIAHLWRTKKGFRKQSPWKLLVLVGQTLEELEKFCSPSGQWDISRW